MVGSPGWVSLLFTYTMRLLLLFAGLLLAAPALGQQTDSLALPGAVLYYYTYGRGEPLLVLSGGPGVAAHQEDDVAQRLGRYFQVILLDQRGTGRSRTVPFDSSTINLRQAVADLEALRLHLGLQKFNLYGHSWGAMLGAAYIAAHPRRVGLFVAVGGGELDASLSAAVTDNVRARQQPQDSARFAYWTRYAATQDAGRGQYELRKLRVARTIYDRTQLEQVMAQVAHGPANPQMSALMWQSIRRELHLPQPIRRYRGPVLVVYGRSDAVGLTTAPQYLQVFPRAQLHGIDRCGHYPEQEQPSAFYGVLGAFLARHLHPAAPPR